MECRINMNIQSLRLSKWIQIATPSLWQGGERPAQWVKDWFPATAHQTWLSNSRHTGECDLLRSFSCEWIWMKMEILEKVCQESHVLSFDFPHGNSENMLRKLRLTLSNTVRHSFVTMRQTYKISPSPMNAPIPKHLFGENLNLEFHNRFKSLSQRRMFSTWERCCLWREKEVLRVTFPLSNVFLLFRQ